MIAPEKRSEPLAMRLRQLIEPAMLMRFASVGVVTTVLDLVLFSAFSASGIPAGAANIGSYSSGIALSYVLNRKFTFASDASALRFAKFVAAMLCGLALSTLLVIVCTMLVPAIVAKIVTVPIVFLWNFVVSRWWVFVRQ